MVGKVPPKQPDAQVEAGEGVGNVGMEGADPPARTDDKVEAGVEGVGGVGKVA